MVYYTEVCWLSRRDKIFLTEKGQPVTLKTEAEYVIWTF